MITAFGLHTEMAQAIVFLGGGAGYTSYKSDVLDAHDTGASGNSFSGKVGLSAGHVSLEAFAQSHNMDGTVKDGDTKYKLKVNGSTVGLAVLCHLNFLYTKLGYAVHSLERTLTDESGENEVSNTSLKNYYEANGAANSNSVVVGAGLQINLGKKFGIYGEYTSYPMTQLNATINTVEVGVRISFDGISNLVKGR